MGVTSDQGQLEGKAAERREEEGSASFQDGSFDEDSDGYLIFARQDYCPGEQVRTHCVLYTCTAQHALPTSALSIGTATLHRSK